PGVDPNDADQGEIGSQPVHWTDPQALEDPVEDTSSILEHVTPRHGYDYLRNHHRNQEDGAYQLQTLEIAVEEQGDSEAADDLESDRCYDEHRGADHGPPVSGVGEHGLKVFQTDEFSFATADQ